MAVGSPRRTRDSCRSLSQPPRRAAFLPAAAWTGKKSGRIKLRPGHCTNDCTNRNTEPAVPGEAGNRRNSSPVAAGSPPEYWMTNGPPLPNPLAAALRDSKHWVAQSGLVKRKTSRPLRWRHGVLPCAEFLPARLGSRQKRSPLGGASSRSAQHSFASRAPLRARGVAIPMTTSNRGTADTSV